jgi:hypothetical protein
VARGRDAGMFFGAPVTNGLAACSVARYIRALGRANTRDARIDAKSAKHVVYFPENPAIVSTLQSLSEGMGDARPFQYLSIYAGELSF